MESETIATFADLARSKARQLRHGPSGFFILSMLAGAYVGFGILLIFALGTPLVAAGSPATKTVMGASFGIALSLVIFAGSELFTGTNLTMTVGVLSRAVPVRSLLGVWAVCYAGNLAGSALLAAGAAYSGLYKGAGAAFVLSASTAKMASPATELLLRGVLCNILVCLAVWCAVRAKSEVAKLVMIFWCLFAFIGAGYEHSVANMTLLSLALFLPHDPAAINSALFARNLGLVTLGNIVGGALFVALPYWAIAMSQRRVAAIVAEPKPASPAPVVLQPVEGT
jgi:nitrite transporter NirC